MGALMSNAKKLLYDLNIAKSKVQFLEAEYRKNCECNEFIGGVRPDMSQNKYNKIYKTCNYHEIKRYHYA